MLKLIAICPLLTLCFHAKSQRILFYCVEKDYLSLHIEKVLNNLENPDLGNKLFTNVTNLNQVSLNITTEKILRSYLEFYSSTFFKSDSIGISELESIEREIRNYDMILIVKPNEFSGLIEYQFSLFDTKIELASIKEKRFRVTNPTKPIATDNIIIDPRKNNYLIEIENSIKRLFPNSSKSPNCKIALSSNIKQKKSKLFCELNDTIKLKVQTDVEAGKQISYNWKIYYKNKEALELLSHIEQKNSDSLLFHMQKNGETIFKVTIFDGIKYSNEDSIVINTIPKSRIIVRKPNIYSKQNTYLLKKSKFTPNTIDVITNFKEQNKKVNISRLLRSNTTDTLLANLKYANLYINYTNDSIAYAEAIAQSQHGSGWSGSNHIPVKPIQPIPIDSFYKEEIEKVDFIYNKKDWGYEVTIPFNTKLTKSGYEIHLEENEITSNTQKFNIYNKKISPFSIGLKLEKTKLSFPSPSNIPDTFNANRFYGGIVLNCKLVKRFSIDAEILFPTIRKLYFDTIRELGLRYTLAPGLTIQEEGLGITFRLPISLSSINKTVKVAPYQVSGRGGTYTKDTKTYNDFFAIFGIEWGISFIPKKLPFIIEIGSKIYKQSNANEAISDSGIYTRILYTFLY